MFWAIATTVLFALAALALLANQKALLAARLLTAMIVGFGLLVWIPLQLTAAIKTRAGKPPRKQVNVPNFSWRL